MRFWGLLGAGIIAALILSYKLDGQAFALLAGVAVMGALAVPFALIFASRNQCEQHPLVRQQEPQPVAPVVIVLASQYQQPQLPDWTPPRWSLPAMQQQPVAQPVWSQPEPTWGGLWDEPEQEPQAQRKFKVIGER